MTVAITPFSIVGTPFNGVNNDQSLVDIWFNLVPTSNYPANGDTANLNSLGDLIKSQYVPLAVSIWGKGNTGFLYNFLIGTTQANGKFLLQTTGVAGAQPPFVDAGAIAY